MNESFCNLCTLALGLALHMFNESQEGRNSCPLLRSCFIGSCHVGVSKCLSHSISLHVLLFVSKSSVVLSRIGYCKTKIPDQDDKYLLPLVPQNQNTTCSTPRTLTLISLRHDYTPTDPRPLHLLVSPLG